MAARPGEKHHNAKLPDREVAIIRRLHDIGVQYHHLAIAWGVSVSCIAGICQHRRRAQEGAQ